MLLKAASSAKPPRIRGQIQVQQHTSFEYHRRGYDNYLRLGSSRPTETAAAQRNSEAVKGETSALTQDPEPHVRSFKGQRLRLRVDSAKCCWNHAKLIPELSTWPQASEQ